MRMITQCSPTGTAACLLQALPQHRAQGLGAWAHRGSEGAVPVSPPPNASALLGVVGKGCTAPTFQGQLQPPFSVGPSSSQAPAGSTTPLSFSCEIASRQGLQVQNIVWVKYLLQWFVFSPGLHFRKANSSPLMPQSAEMAGSQHR